jgi:hypothetical protein
MCISQSGKDRASCRCQIADCLRSVSLNLRMSDRPELVRADSLDPPGSELASPMRSPRQTWATQLELLLTRLPQHSGAPADLNGSIRHRVPGSVRRYSPSAVPEY